MAEDIAAPSPTTASPAAPIAPQLQSAHVYAMAVICLVTGLGVGYLMRSSQLATPAVKHATITSPHATLPPGHPHSLEEMKQISDQHAAPLIEKLKSNPRDTALLAQIAALYHTTHRFNEAADYYNRAVASDPKNVALRIRLASSLFRSGDTDGAIAQLNQALVYDSKNANALFDLGMIKLQGKNDSKGAIAAWERLLKTNPNLSADRRAVVNKVIANAETAGANPGSDHANN
jgi:cytochrome c-type biogenesis protein CcmH/NrfG